MRNKRLTAMDIGTNSIRSIVVEVEKTGKFRVLDDEKATVRLGEGLYDSGLLSAVAALLRQRKIISSVSPPPRERELIATGARYHRKFLPKKKHEEFRPVECLTVVHWNV